VQYQPGAIYKWAWIIPVQAVTPNFMILQLASWSRHKGKTSVSILKNATSTRKLTTYREILMQQIVNHKFLRAGNCKYSLQNIRLIVGTNLDIQLSGTLEKF